MFWNYHEDVKGVMDWETESRNLREFLQTAQDAGLFINLRIGPYGPPLLHTSSPHSSHSSTISPRRLSALCSACGGAVCAEWYFGGLPLWLRDNSSIELRYYDPLWLEPVGRFITYVTKYVEPYLARNGGPIILAQIENEYGSGGNDPLRNESAAVSPPTTRLARCTRPLTLCVCICG